MSSSWDETRKRSRYHFDPQKHDPKYDTVIRLGRVINNWSHLLPGIVANSDPVTWRTRGNPNKPSRPESELAAEEYDLERAGYGRDYKVTDLNWNIPPELQQLADSFGFADSMTRIHVQHPGQVWNLHLDKLEKWCPEDPFQVMRVMIQLSDWQPGHFWIYGNYHFSGWQAGDVTTFDWINVPHATANAGLVPRVTLQVTGIYTDKTHEFLRSLT
jgi:hypothetical protein